MLQSLFTVLDQFFIYLPLLIGAYISFSLMKIPNFSIEPAFVTGAVVATLIMPFVQGMPQPVILILIVIASLFGGGLIGLIASGLNTAGRIPHLLAHILTMGIGFGLNLFLLGVPNQSLTNFANPLTMEVIRLHPELLVTGVLGVLLLMKFLFFLRSQIGFCIAIYGNNPRFFSTSEASVSYIVCLGVILSNALAGLSGYLVSQSSGFVDITAGSGIALFCLTSLILGKTASNKVNMFERLHISARPELVEGNERSNPSTSSGRAQTKRFSLYQPKVVSVFIPTFGLLMYCIIQQLLLKLGFNLKYFMVFQALIVVVLLIIHYRKHSVPDVHTDHLGI
jgi:putative tryptophan/tyrosine transport system permease protein